MLLKLSWVCFAFRSTKLSYHKIDPINCTNQATRGCPEFRFTCLSGVSLVDELNTFISSKAVHIQLVGIPTSMPFLFGPTIMKLHPLNTNTFDEHLRTFNKCLPLY